MAIERRNPLPVGHYWVHVEAGDSQAFNSWLMASGDAVQVVASQAPRDGWEWVRFDVRRPVVWLGPGYPTITREGVTRESQVVDEPDPQAPIEDRLGGGVSSALKTAAMFAAGAAALALMMGRQR